MSLANGEAAPTTRLYASEENHVALFAAMTVKISNKMLAELGAPDNHIAYDEF